MFNKSGDYWFGLITLLLAWTIPLLFLSLFLMLVIRSAPSIQAFGPGFVFNSAWDPVKGNYGALPFIYGTFVSSLIALLIAVPLGVGAAIFLSDVSKLKINGILATMIDLLAAIPSVVYGLWGIFVLGPLLVAVIPGMQQGQSMLTGGVILAIMILPTITAVSREVLQTVPLSLREAAMALGATRWETIKIAVIPPAASGIVGSIILGLGRAVGETMAVTMVIGNRPEISASLFAPGYTLASVIANEFAEATSPLNLSVMVEIGLILLVFTVIINGFARVLVWKITAKK